MRPMRRCKKPRLDGGSDEEDEKEKELNALVRKLPCYQGEGSKKSLEVEDDVRQLEEKQRQLVEERKQLEKELNKLKERNALARKPPCSQGEGSMANEPRKSLGVGGDEKQLEEKRRQLDEERKQLTEEWEKVDEVNFKMQEDKAMVEIEKAELKREKAELKKEKSNMEEKKTKIDKETAKMEEEKAKLEEERVRFVKMSREQESLVECPVCLSLPREDMAVPCCPKGHFVCSPCLDNLISQGKPGNCPTCRVPMGQGRSLLALTVVKNAQHECGHQGCHVKLKIHQIKDHEEKCIWRLILCPGKGTFCTARVPLSTLLNHVQTCIDCKWPPKQVNREGTLIENKIGMDRVGGLNANWPTTVLQLEGGFFFFVRCAKKDGNYVVDVVMKGSQEDCEDFMVEASLLNVESGKSVFKASFQPRPLTNQNEAIYSLSVPEKGVSKAWKYDDSEGNYQIRFLVKILKVD